MFHFVSKIVLGDPSCLNIKKGFSGCCGQADLSVPNPAGTPVWMANPEVNLTQDMYGFAKYNELAGSNGLFPAAVNFPVYPDAQWLLGFDSKLAYASSPSTVTDFDVFKGQYFEDLRKYMFPDAVTRPPYTYDATKSFFENTNIVSLPYVKFKYNATKPSAGMTGVIAGANSNQGGAAAILLSYLGAKKVTMMSRTELSFTRYKNAAMTSGSMTTLWTESVAWCQDATKPRSPTPPFPDMTPGSADMFGAASAASAAIHFSFSPNFDGFDESQFLAAGITDFYAGAVWNKIVHVVGDVRNKTQRDSIRNALDTTPDYLIASGNVWGNAKTFNPDMAKAPKSGMPSSLSPSPYVLPTTMGGVGLTTNPNDTTIMSVTPDGSTPFVMESSRLTQQAFDDYIREFVYANSATKVLAITSGLNYLSAYTSFGPLAGMGEYMTAKIALRQSMYNLGLHGVFLPPHVEKFLRFYLPSIHPSGTFATYEELASPYDITMVAPTLIANDFNTFQAATTGKLAQTCPNFDNLHQTYANRLNEYANLKQLEILLSVAQELGVFVLTSGMSATTWIPAILHDRTITPAAVPNKFNFSTDLYPLNQPNKRSKRFAEFYQGVGLNNFNSGGMDYWGVFGGNAPFLNLSKTPTVENFLKAPFQEATAALQMFSAATQVL